MRYLLAAMLMLAVVAASADLRSEPQGTAGRYQISPLPTKEAGYSFTWRLDTATGDVCLVGWGVSSDGKVSKVKKLDCLSDAPQAP